MAAPSNARELERRLTLYVAGNSRRALAAMGELRRFVDERRADGWQLEVVDVLQHPAVAADADVCLTPTLVARVGASERRFVGRFDELAATLSQEVETRRT